MARITEPARNWFRNKLEDNKSGISQLLVKTNQHNLGWPIYEMCTATSKYFEAGESYPGIPVWWPQIPIKKLQGASPCMFFFLVCQKRTGDVSDFHLLAIPKSFLLEQLSKGNVDTLWNCACLHLSTEKCTYRGYEVSMFYDVRVTMRFGRRPMPFAQYVVVDC